MSAAVTAACPAPIEANGYPKRTAKSLQDMLEIASHPAFRLGILDAASGSPFDPGDKISKRIYEETPRRARGMWGGWVSDGELELAQKRYEEGRICLIGWRLKVRAWSDPRFPPKVIREWCASVARTLGEAS
jgi:hypothetical protein